MVLYRVKFECEGFTLSVRERFADLDEANAVCEALIQKGFAAKVVEDPI